jgi:hypothetical protein
LAWLVTGEPAPGFLWGALAALFCAVWIGLRLDGRVDPQPWFLGLAVFCLLDWGLVANSMFTPRSPQVVFAENETLSAFLARQPGYFRIYSPSYSLPQQMAARYRLQLADGVDPLQLSTYVAFMEAATGVPVGGYSVTLPHFAGGEPKTDNAAYLPNPSLLGWLNVRYIAAEFELNVNGLVFLEQFGDTRLYENQHVLPRAWVQPIDAPVGESLRPVQLLEWAPERIALAAEGPGMLVLSELAYPGWQVQVDGQPEHLLLVAELLRGVQLDPGEHQVVFNFRSESLSLGLGLWALASVFLLASAMIKCPIGRLFVN